MMERFERVRSWYTNRARPALAKNGSDHLEALDGHLRELETLLSTAPEPTEVCIIGDAGAGKSTLLNALVADQQTVVPQGGVGPLTAQATRVVWSERAFIEAEYFSGTQLNQLRHILEMELRRRLQDSDDDVTRIVSMELSREQLFDATLPEGEEGATAFNDYARQACLLLRGDADANLDLRYLADGIRRCLLKNESYWGTELTPEDARRVQAIRKILDQIRRGTKSFKSREAMEPRAFAATLKDHSTGFLAPLIKQLTVGWPAEFLRTGLTLIDLPGLGVANDQHRHVTARHIRKAVAILLVVRRGITDSTSNLLLSSGFVNSLLHSESSDARRSHLVVARNAIDEAVSDFRKQEFSEGRQKPPWPEAFGKVEQKAKSTIAVQLRDFLARQDAERGSTILREIGESIEVHAVSAREHQKFHEKDDEERAVIPDEQYSGVGALRQSLAGLAIRARERQEEERMRKVRLFMQQVAMFLEELRDHLSESSRQSRELESLIVEVRDFCAPRRMEIENRRGAYRNYLNEGLPRELDLGVQKAIDEARNDLRKYVQGLRSFHWATLRAAVRRGGVFAGARHVDLPNEMTLRLEAPVAVTWSRDILVGLRAQTARLGADYRRLAGEVVSKVEELCAEEVSLRVRARFEDLGQQLDDVDGAGAKDVEEVRERVKFELYQDLEAAIRKACQEFVESNQDRGAGVKGRIHELIEKDLLEQLIDAGRTASSRALKEPLQESVSAIRSRFQNVGEPVAGLEAATVRALADQQATGLRAEPTDIDRAIQEMPE